MRARTAERARIALVGPRTDAHGGVAGFIHALLESPLAERYELIPVWTHREGPRALKLAVGAWGLGRLWRLCATGRVDLVHVNSSWGASIVRKAAAVAIARRCGVPVVLQLHGSGFQHGLQANDYRSALARRAAQSASVVVAATPAWATEAAGLLGVESVAVVPNAAASEDVRAEHDTFGPVVLFLGRLERAKGVFELLDAVAALAPSHPELRLVLAGSGRDTAAVRAAIAASGLEETVDLPGWVSGDEKRRLLAEAGCLVLPSHDEGLPLALLEAMGSGVPVVATSVGGIPEAARNGREALLVPPKDVGALRDALDRILSDDLLAHRLSRAARTRACTYFAADRVAAELGALYDRVLGSSDHRGAPGVDNALQPALD